MNTPSVCITITGPQGSGKSTVAAALANMLEAHGLKVETDLSNGHPNDHTARSWMSVMPALRALRVARTVVEIREIQE